MTIFHWLIKLSRNLYKSKIIGALQMVSETSLISLKEHKFQMLDLNLNDHLWDVKISKVT